MSNAAKVSQDLASKAAALDTAKAGDAESTTALSEATDTYKKLIADSQAKLAETDAQLVDTRAKIEGFNAELAAADKKAEENAALIAQLNATIAKLQKPQTGGALDTHPILALAAAISAAATTLLPCRS